MIIREAHTEDMSLWDSFVDSEHGSLNHRFNWKYFFEEINDRFIPMIIENDSSQLIGILPIVKEKRLLYSKLNSDISPSGLLLKKDLPENERNEAILKVLEFVDANYSKGCSRFVLSEFSDSVKEIVEEPTKAFLKGGYTFKYDPQFKLPCTFVIELEQPFEEKIWKKLWTHKLRNSINRAEKTGVTVSVDNEFTHLEDFIEMLAANYKRHGTMPLTRQQIMIALDMVKAKPRLYVAKQDNQLIFTLMVYYHSSDCVLWEIGSYTKGTDNANLVVYKRVFEDACNAGCKYVYFGWTGTPGLALFKQKFRGVRIPFRTYEKRYSLIRLLLEFVSLAIERTRYDKLYLWKQRDKIWNLLTQR